MTLVSKSIPNLINGVSQQPPSLRLGSQGETQENGLSDVVDGLKKRPPTKFLKKLVKCNTNWLVSTTALPLQGNLSNSNVETLTSSELDAAFIHTYKRSGDEQYTVVILPDATTPIVLVYDILGNLRYQSGKSSWLADGSNITYTVKGASDEDITTYNNTDDTSYLVGVGATAIDKIAVGATSVADATFIVNKDKVVAMDSFISPQQSGYNALVFLKSTNYGRRYKITLKSKSGTYTGSVVGTANTVDALSGNTNSDVLKVSETLGTLRSSLITAGGSSIFTAGGQEQQGSRSTSTTQSIRGLGAFTSAGTYYHTAAQDLLEITLATTTYNADPTRLIIAVGGTNVDYNAGGVLGWKYHPDHATNKKIMLPVSVLETERSMGTMSGGTRYFYKRPHVEMRQLDVDSNGDVTTLNNVAVSLSPFTYAEEPFFVIQSPEGGTLKDFSITATDDDGGTNLRVFKDAAPTFTSLPNQCIDGFRIGVVGDNNKKEDDFHVVFSGSAGSGYWKESVAAGLENYFDLSTMPHALRQDPDQIGSLRFSFAESDWDKRQAGDDNTNPAPSFVGQTISDIFFHRNRLGVLAGENVIFSGASSYFNFWRTTVRSLLDSDPIDIAVSQNEVSVLKAAVPIQDNLLLFTELNQFTLSAAQLLTPTEVTIDQSTKFECDLEATPVGAGTSVFFATKTGGFAGVREYYTNNETEIKDAALITSHVPQYLQGNIREMATSSNENMLLCLTSSNKKECYVFKWYDQSNERLQSSWSKWKFAKDIASTTFNNSKIYFVFTDGSFEYVDLAPASVEPTTTFGGAGGGTVTPFSPIYFPTVNGNGQFSTAAWTSSPSLGSFYLSRSTNTLGLTFLNNWPYSDQLTSISFGSTVLNITDAVVSTTGMMGYSYTTYNFTLTDAQLATMDADADNIAVGGGLRYLPASFQVGGSAQSSITFKKAGLEALLDHQVRLEASTVGGEVTSLVGLYVPTPLTQFVNYKGEIIGTGNSAATQAKVVAAISQKTHLESGQTVNDYIYAGEPYQFKYKLSEQVYKPVDGDYTDLSRLQLRSISFNYNDTGTFDVDVKSRGRDTKTTAFTGRILGQKDNILDYSPVVERGSIKVGVQSQAKETEITITNDSHLPCVFQSAEWEGFITLRNKRL